MTMAMTMAMPLDSLDHCQAEEVNAATR